HSLGFGDDDVRDGGSDRLVDAVIAWGDADALLARVRAHLAAGADHVCVQVLPEDPRTLPLPEWRGGAPAPLSSWRAAGGSCREAPGPPRRPPREGGGGGGGHRPRGGGGGGGDPAGQAGGRA